MTTKPAHTTHPYPLSRQLIIDFNRLAREKNIIHGLVEFDVTEPMSKLRQHESKTGNRISFTAFILHCLGQAVAEHPKVQAYRYGRKRYVTFEDVDIATVIETEFQGARYPMSHVIRAAQKKGVIDIHTEIRTVQANKGRSASMGHWKRMNWVLYTPWFLRRQFYLWIKRDPFRHKRLVGAVSLSALGMYASGMSGWGINFPNHTLNITLGGIAEKPSLVNGEIVVRKVLNVTVAVDHDLVDGAPATEFTGRFKELVENCTGLDQLA